MSGEGVSVGGALAIATRTRRIVPTQRERLADLETPVSAFAKLRRAFGGAFLLESAEGGEHMGRFSFIGVLPRVTLSCRDGIATIRDEGGAQRTVPYKDPLDVIRT